MAATDGVLFMILAGEHVLLDSDRQGPGWVETQGERVVRCGLGAPPLAADLRLDDGWLAPGLVDTHCHGGGGYSFSDGASAARNALAAHAAHGTSSVVASLVSDRLEVLERQIGELAPLVRSGELAGVHLEGPWLSPGRRGAHDAASLSPLSPEAVDRLVPAGQTTVRMVTLAPELPGGLEAVTRLRERGVVVALGHTDADAATTREAVARGASVATHLFNAMPPLHHREPGPAGVCLADPDVVVELVCDGVHLDPAVVELAARAATGRFVLVTDAMAAAAAADGSYRLGGVDVEVADGVARVVGTPTIAGSTLTLEGALRVALSRTRLGLGELLPAVTSTPARALGLGDRGHLRPGALADIVHVSASGTVTALLQRGRPAVSYRS